jgi:N6-adenosine-specific RNA methylase IME4
MRPSEDTTTGKRSPSLNDPAAKEQTAAHGGTWPIVSIRVGERYRRDLGDIDGFAAIIARIGLMHPIVITPDGTLIAGRRRLEACKRLGWSHIPVTVLDLDEIVRGEYAENAYCKAFTPSEMVAIAEALAPFERAKAKERQGRRTDQHPENFSTSSGRALDKVATVAGISRPTKARAIVEAATAEPEKFGKLIVDMDRTGRVNAPYRRLTNIKAAEAIRAVPPPLPGQGPYRGGMADIAWAYESDDENAPHRGVLPYPTLSLEQVCALDVAAILAEDVVVGMWVTNFVLARGLHVPVLQAWGGLEAKTVITWPKDRIGRGHWVKGQTEHLVIATRGKPLVTLNDQTTLLKGPFHLVQKNKHSAKPIEAYAYFESLYPGHRYFDLFSRYQYNDRWDPHGFEAPTEKPTDTDDLSIPPFLRRPAPS